jgi:hypothetical protein
MASRMLKKSLSFLSLLQAKILHGQLTWYLYLSKLSQYKLNPKNPKIKYRIKFKKHYSNWVNKWMYIYTDLCDVDFRIFRILYVM